MNQPSSIAARLGHFKSNWMTLTQDPWIQQTISGYKIPFTSPPRQWRPRITRATQPEMKQNLLTAISSLISKGAVKEVAPHPDEFLSTLFLVEKQDKSGKYRPVINLKALNQFLPKETFKMESLNTVRSLLRPEDFMMKIDLKDAYDVLPIYPHHRKYLRFKFEGVTYEFQCLPFGLASAPRAFTKLLKPLVAVIRSKGIRIVIFLDDLLIMHQDKVQCQKIFSQITHLLSNLGFLIKQEKCSSCPTQQITFLGALLNNFNDHYLTRGQDGIDCTDQPSDAFDTSVLITRTLYPPGTHEPCSSNRCLDSPAPLPHASEDTHRSNSALGFEVEEAHSSATRFCLERPGMVDSTRTCSVQSTSNSITSLRPVDQNGCLPDRVGRYLQQPVHRWSLGSTGSKTAYQCIGIEGCLPGPAVIPQPDTSPSSAYPPRDEQYHCSGIPQQERWNPLYNALRSSPTNMGIRVEQRILDNGSSHPWSAQCGSRPCIKRVQPSYGVDVRQGDFQADHSVFLCSGNRLVRFSVEPPSTPLCVSGPGPGVDDSRCFSAELGQMEEFYSPASCTSLTHYPEGATGQGNNAASCSQLARATVVSGIVSDADRSPTAVTNQGVAANPAIPTRDDSPTVAFSAPDGMAFHRRLSRFSSPRGLQPPRKGTVPPGILGLSSVPVMDCVQFQHL